MTCHMYGNSMGTDAKTLQRTQFTSEAANVLRRLLLLGSQLGSQGGPLCCPGLLTPAGLLGMLTQRLHAHLITPPSQRHAACRQHHRGRMIRHLLGVLQGLFGRLDALMQSLHVGQVLPHGSDLGSQQP